MITVLIVDYSPQGLRRDGGKWPAITPKAAGGIGMKRRFGISESTAGKYNKIYFGGWGDGRQDNHFLFRKRNQTSPRSPTWFERAWTCTSYSSTARTFHIFCWVRRKYMILFATTWRHWNCSSLHMLNWDLSHQTMFVEASSIPDKKLVMQYSQGWNWDISLHWCHPMKKVEGLVRPLLDSSKFFLPMVRHVADRLAARVIPQFVPQKVML